MHAYVDGSCMAAPPAYRPFEGFQIIWRTSTYCKCLFCRANGVRVLCQSSLRNSLFLRISLRVHQTVENNIVVSNPRSYSLYSKIRVVLGQFGMAPPQVLL
jgi:hypothetical protein